MESDFTIEFQDGKAMLNPALTALMESYKYTEDAEEHKTLLISVPVDGKIIDISIRARVLDLFKFVNSGLRWAEISTRDAAVTAVPRVLNIDPKASKVFDEILRQPFKPYPDPEKRT